MISRLGVRTEQPARTTGPAVGAPGVSRRLPPRFYAGLCALVLLTVFGGLAVIGVAISLLPAWHGVAITSGSMEPGIRAGDFVLVNTAPELVRDGQVITYVDPIAGDRVTHRIIEVLDDGSVITKGDANVVADPIPVEPAAIIGAARLIVPFVGYPAYWVSTMQFHWLVLTLLIGVGSVTLARSAWVGEQDEDPEAIVVDLR